MTLPRLRRMSQAVWLPLLPRRFFRGWMRPLSTLTHIFSTTKPGRNDAARIDREILNDVEESDYYNMSRNFEQRAWKACGGGGVITSMMAAERLGANRAETQPGLQRDTAPSLAQPEKDYLLKIARSAVETAVREGNVPQCSGGGFEALEQDRDAFVTLTKRGQLRGCIGYVSAGQPLYLTVRDAAVMAALRDTRFSPVTVEELAELEYEISVLSPLDRVQDVEQIRVGTHGLMISNGELEGLLLPQVPVEQHWDRATFLQQVCRKAGLGSDAWSAADTNVFSFTALVFGEKDGA